MLPTNALVSDPSYPWGLSTWVSRPLVLGLSCSSGSGRDIGIRSTCFLSTASRLPTIPLRFLSHSLSSWIYSTVLFACSCFRETPGRRRDKRVHSKPLLSSLSRIWLSLSRFISSGNRISWEIIFSVDPLEILVCLEFPSPHSLPQMLKASQKNFCIGHMLFASYLSIWASPFFQGANSS